LKIDEQNPASHTALDEIITSVLLCEQQNRKLIDVSPDTDTSIHSNDNILQAPFISKNNKSEQISSKSKQEKKKNPSVTVFLILISICLIILFTRINFLYGKYAKQNENENLANKQSNSTYVSQISNKCDSVKSQNDFSIPRMKQQSVRRTTNNWFKLDEGI
jgi:hypothetical protein